MALPEAATDAVIDPESIAELQFVAARFLGKEEGDMQVVRKGLCFRPVTLRRVPIMAKVPDRLQGAIDQGHLHVFITAGHGP